MTLHLHHIPEPDAVAKQVSFPIHTGEIVAVTRHEQGDIFIYCGEAGGQPRGFVLSNADAQALIDALHSVRGGRHG